ncbi:hypothetical protein VL20_2751 [Microcystis panniformis FACHB-1757]|uniref:Uncharacterized protein n=1 Tax=Microcystis panniformis FACHB-1757 TaxID=1638788 RepID=A0A0K1S172_9CHRO|nr:hypothetical protein VL20_2751 [Microcystis panniformis FACHB-1757]
MSIKNCKTGAGNQLSVISYQLSDLSFKWVGGIKYKMNVGWVEA